MKYTTYLFDWDGTLLDSLPVWYGIFQDTFGEFLDELDPEQRKQCINYWENIRKYIEINDERWAEYIEVGSKLAHERIQKLDLFPHVLEVLQALHKNNVKTALITRSFRNVLGNMLEHHGLIGAFDVIIAREDSEKHKPDPEPLFKAMEELGANPEETIMVGDSETDLLAARNAKIDSILFFPAKHEEIYNRKFLESLAPKYKYESWDDFLKLVQ